MSEQVLLAILGVAASAVAVAKIVVEGVNWAFRFLVEQLNHRMEIADARAEKMLDQCAEERAAFLATLNGILREIHEDLKEHTTISKEMYHGLQELRKE